MKQKIQRSGDTKITLRMPDGTEINTEVVEVKEQDNGKVMLIFKINKGVEDLIQYRKISLDIIWWSYSGLKIPNSAIIQENELNYVIRNRTGYKDKILVKILKQNQDYSIIENYKTEELRNLGYTQQQIVSMKSIGLYDEISIQKDS